MTYLNDIKEGGETEFYYQKLKDKTRDRISKSVEQFTQKPTEGYYSL